MDSQASYDELIKQVLNLQRENTDLRRELENSSSHLRQIESDSSTIKDSLINVRLSLSETDTRAAAAAYDAAMSDTYASRQTPPPVMPVSDPGFVDHSYTSSGSKSLTDAICSSVITTDHSFLRNAEFLAEPRNLPVSAEFLEIQFSWNFADFVFGFAVLLFMQFRFM